MINGILGRKVGMTQIFRPDGIVIPVTVIQAGPVTVTQVKQEGKDGYDAVQVGYGNAKRLTSPEKGHLKKLGLLRHLREFKAEGETPKVGDKIDVTMFSPGDSVDISGTSKGKGFAGVVKRHHFAGGPKTHGQSDRERAGGSIGATTTPGRVLKGMRMAGHMGSDRVTVQNLKVVSVDADRSLLLVRGAVPGAPKGLLEIRKSIKGD
ncbi:MAG: 50S ribosomal protein L3 [Dehalococcoidia bacterium]|nr:50S ribosomal protein L3 [Dehalococcoidia bacterium]